MSSDSLPAQTHDENESLGPSEFEDVYQRMLSLESELIEFQESSKELEQALEEELRELESKNSRLVAQVKTQDVKIRTLSEKVIELNTEINGLHDVMVEKTEAYNKETRDLKSKLVSTEILNDDMVSHDRVLESKLQLSTQFNNELLEKLAIVENDLELEKQENAKHKLTISNLENAASSRRRSRRMPSTQGLDSEEVTFADGTILDINEMLASEPSRPSEPRIPKSGSLTKMQNLFVKSEVLRQKAGDMTSTLASYTGDESSKRYSRVLADSHDGGARSSKGVERKRSKARAGEAKEKAERPSTAPLESSADPTPHRERTSSLPARKASASEVHSPTPGTVKKSSSVRHKTRPAPKKGFRTSMKKIFF